MTLANAFRYLTRNGILRAGGSASLRVSVTAVFAFAILGFVSPFPARAAPSFVATCEDVTTKSFFSGTDIFGERMATEWTDDNFPGPELATISYAEGDQWVTLFFPERCARLVAA